MGEQGETKRRQWVGWFFPRRGKWKWAVLRFTLAAVALIVFRYEVLAWAVAGHNVAWKAVTGSERNNPTDIALLRRLRGPGAHMLVRIGEDTELLHIRDPGAVGALLDVAHSDKHSLTRASALRGLSEFWDDRIVPAALKSLSDPDPYVRREAANVIGELGDERFLPELKKAEQAEQDAGVRAAITHAMAELIPVPEPYTGGGKTVKVAAVQFISEMGEPERNRARLEPFIRKAARNGAKIVVLPETAITGYMNHELNTTWQVKGREITRGLKGIPPDRAAGTVPGPSTDRFSALAKELGIYLTIPFIEREPATGKFFNTIVLAGPDGRLLLHYRKLNPWPFAECGWATRGDRGIQTVDTPHGRLGLLVCFDINYEPPNLKRKKVDTLLYCIAWVDKDGSSWYPAVLPRIARRNDINIIGANWTVPRKSDWYGYGHSLVIERTGRVLARVSDDLAEEIVYAELPVPPASR